MWLSYNNTYECSEEGIIRNKITKRIMKIQKCRYLRVSLNGKPTEVHKVIGRCFLPAPTELKLQIDHINRNCFDNRASNLRWVSQSVNQLNRDVFKNNKLQHKNICLSASNKYRVQIKKNKKHNKNNKIRQDKCSW